MVELLLVLLAVVVVVVAPLELRVTPDKYVELRFVVLPIPRLLAIF
jgi:hypothetical protein